MALRRRLLISSCTFSGISCSFCCFTGAEDDHGSCFCRRPLPSACPVRHRLSGLRCYRLSVCSCGFICGGCGFGRGNSLGRRGLNSHDHKLAIAGSLLSLYSKIDRTTCRTMTLAWRVLVYSWKTHLASHIQSSFHSPRRLSYNGWSSHQTVLHHCYPI